MKCCSCRGKHIRVQADGAWSLSPPPPPSAIGLHKAMEVMYLRKKRFFETSIAVSHAAFCFPSKAGGNMTACFPVSYLQFDIHTLGFLEGNEINGSMQIVTLVWASLYYCLKRITVDRFLEINRLVW